MKPEIAEFQLTSWRPYWLKRTRAFLFGGNMRILQLCNKSAFYMRKECNPRMIFLVHQRGRCFIVFCTNNNNNDNNNLLFTRRKIAFKYMIWCAIWPPWRLVKRFNQTTLLPDHMDTKKNYRRTHFLTLFLFFGMSRFN